MNLNYFEELLNEDEGTSLDFKREQYQFAGADNQTKAELLKDILAFANAWRRTDAYILIGVEEVKGGKSKVLGIIDHLNDNDLQQFVNEKSQRPLAFSYQTLVHPEGQIGIIHIPVQQRPFYLKADFGGLKKDTVYLRRGSSTAIATLDEVAQMGVPSDRSVDQPSISVEFFDPVYGNPLGTEISICSTHLIYDLAKMLPPLPMFNFGGNPNYEEEMAAYKRTVEFLKAVKLKVTNGPTLAENVLLIIEVPKMAHLVITDSIPSEPSRTSLVNISALSTRHLKVSSYEVENKPAYWNISVNCGTLRPRASIIPRGCFYVGSHFERDVTLSGLIFGNNITNPIQVDLKMSFTVQQRNLDPRELR
jgi:hypothetical protein